MKYDPIKRTLGRTFNATPWLRILFYRMLDLLLLRSWYIRKEIRLWAGHKTGKQKILDAGAGFGQYSYFFSRLNRNWSIEAVDVKEEQVRDCNNFFYRINRKNVLFEVADLTQYRKEDNFDLILSVDVMEHIEQDELVFRNFYDSLTQEGMLLISTPSDQGGSDVHDHEEDHSFIEEHVRDGYGIADITGKLQRAGFARVEAHYSYGGPGQLAWRLSMKYPILMLGASKIFFIILPLYYIITFPISYICNYIDIRVNHSTGTGLVVKAWK